MISAFGIVMSVMIHIDIHFCLVSTSLKLFCFFLSSKFTNKNIMMNGFVFTVFKESVNLADQNEITGQIKN